MLILPPVANFHSGMADTLELQPALRQIQTGQTDPAHFTNLPGTAPDQVSHAAS